MWINIVIYRRNRTDPALRYLRLLFCQGFLRVELSLYLYHGIIFQTHYKCLSGKVMGIYEIVFENYRAH